MPRPRAAGDKYHEFDLAGGIFTKFRSEDVLNSGLLQAINCDPNERYRALGKVHGSSRASDDHGASVESIHFFEAFDLQAQLQRKVVTLAGGALRFVDTGTSALTNLGVSGLTNEALKDVVFNDRLHLCSPSNDPRKVDIDGSVTNWGVKPPGTERTTLEAFEDQSNFTINGTNTKADSTDSAPEFSDSSTSVQVNKLDTSTTDAILTRSSLSLDFSDAGSNKVFALLFLPSGSIGDLASTNAVTVTYGNAALTAADVFNYGPGSFVDGWNLVTMDTSAPDSQIGAGATLGSIATIRFTITLSANSTTRSGFLWSFLHKNEEGAPTTAVGGSGTVTGDKRYVVSFLTRYGQESNAGAASSTVSPAGQSVSLTNVPVSADPQVVARRIYRDDTGDALFRFVGSIDDNTTTTFTDNVDNDSLSFVQAAFAGDATLDNSPPPRLLDVVEFRSHVIAISAENRFRLIISEPNTPEAFPINNDQVFEDELTGLEVRTGGVVIFASDRTFFLSGTSVDNFTVEETSPNLGTAGRRSHAVVKGISPVSWHDDGPYLLNNPFDPWYVGTAIRDTIESFDAAQFSQLFVLHDRRRFRVVFFVKASNGSITRILVWSYGKKSTGALSGEGSGIDPTDVRVGGWFELDLPSSVDVRCAVQAEESADLPIVLVGAGDGRVYKLQDESTSDYATASSSEPVSMTIETHDVPIGGGRDGRGTARYLAVNGEFNQATQLTFTVETRDDSGGTLLQSRSWTTPFSSGNDSKVISIPSPGVKGQWARVKITNARTGERPVIKSLRLYYTPQRTFGGPR